jgi:hypothetical protein
MPDQSVMRSGPGRVPRLVLLGVLMLVVLAGTLWASGMGRSPGDPDAGRPTYQLPDNRPSDVSPR